MIRFLSPRYPKSQLLPAKDNIYEQPAVQSFRPGKVNGKHDATPSASLSLLAKTVNEEGFSVPRLSIIVPHRNDHQLEETILSILENRPRDCEIIVAHDGSYCDPYHLADEVVYVQEEPKSTVVELLNAGLMAACSPVVCALLDGMVVSPNWSEPALKRFANPEVVAVAPKLQVGRSVVTGIASEAIRNAASLRSGRVDSKHTSAAAPALAAGFYRRRSLLALGGWNDEVGPGSADVDLALMFSELGLVCECESQIVFQAALEAVPSRISKDSIGELAGIAAAHGIASASLGATILSVVFGALTGSVSSALAWSSGLSNATVTQEVAERLAYARKQLGKDSASTKADSENANAQIRKAA